MSREIVIIVDYIAFSYPRPKAKSIRANAIESLFSTY